jgi:hypothetical protein
MASVTEKRATIDDLYRTKEKAELIGGRIVHLIATGCRPNQVAGRIYRSLAEHADAKGVSQPTVYVRGQMAEAEPAVPGWKVLVDWIFAE